MKICILLLIYQIGYSQIDLSAIAIIESNNNPYAWNKSDGGSRGLYQISPIGLKDYNNHHTIKYKLNDLFNPIINRKIANWHFNVRIPYMIKYYKVPHTTDNILIAYNAGIKYLINKEDIPATTKLYIIKYKKLIASK